MKLKPSQVRKVQTITANIHKYFGAKDYPQQSGAFGFDLTPVAGNAVMLSASNNNGLRWFETHHHFLVIIGPRGGVERFEEASQEDNKKLACHKSLILG